MSEGLRLALGAHFTAHILLHAALLTPPSVLSHGRLAAFFLPMIWALHISTLNHGLGYVAAIHTLWATELLLFRNPRQDFAIIHSGKPPLSPVDNKLSSDRASDEKKDSGADAGLDRATAAVEETEAKIKDRTRAQISAGESHRIAWTEQFPHAFWRRFIWVSNLVVSFRYIGWSTSTSQAVLYSSQPPPKATKSRTIFILQKLLLMGLCLGILDVTNFYQYFDPYFQVEYSIDDPFPRRLNGFFIRNHLICLSPRLVRIAAFVSQQFATFSLLGAIPAVLFVTLGGLGLVSDFWGRPENWHSLMGNPLAIARRGLRGVWGSFWHQLLRNVSDARLTVRYIFLTSLDSTRSRKSFRSSPRIPRTFHHGLCRTSCRRLRSF